LTEEKVGVGGEASEWEMGGLGRKGKGDDRIEEK